MYSAPLRDTSSMQDSGYVWLGFFSGYGENILDYNQHRWIARIGYSITR
ncbi:outer membrane phospholipase A [Paraburkholderia youngii]